MSDQPNSGEGIIFARGTAAVTLWFVCVRPRPRAGAPADANADKRAQTLLGLRSLLFQTTDRNSHSGSAKASFPDCCF